MTHDRRYQLRKWKSYLMLALCAGALAAALFPLFSILWEVFSRGLPFIDIEFLTQRQLYETSSEGGIANAIWGSFYVVGLASSIGIPIGMMAGIYLAEFGRGRISEGIRFFADVFANFPSIVIGLFAYLTVFRAVGHPSVLSGAFALAVLMVPFVTRTTEEALRLVPDSIREGALALGIPAWRSTVRVTLPSARGALVTGAMLAFARIFGETAPLIVTLGAALYFADDLDDPTNVLTTVVFNGARSSYQAARDNAWGAAALLLIIVLAINITIRFFALRGRARAAGAT